MSQNLVLKEVIIRTSKLSQKRMNVSSDILSQKDGSLCLSRASIAPESVVSILTSQPRKRKIARTVMKQVGSCKKIKQSSQNQAFSLEDALKGRSLSVEQIKKKEMLDIPLPREGGIRLSQYLHERGFTYDSQAALVGVKKVENYMINYLVALFFRESENPLKEPSLDPKVLDRISNKWCVLKDIEKDVDLKITPEEVVLSLLKHQGVAYESLIIFLELFESNERLFRPQWDDKHSYPKYEELNYPSSKIQFMSDFLDIAQGGHVSLKKFVETFITPRWSDVSEWEEMKGFLWDDLFEFAKKQSHLEGCVVRHDEMDWKIVSDSRSDSKRRKLSMVSQENPEIKKVIFIVDENERKEKIDSHRDGIGTFLIKDPNVSEGMLLSHFIKCVKANGGASNKHAFIDCLKNARFYLDGKKETLFNFLRSEKGGGLSSFEAIQVITNCIGTDGGSKNKHAFVECLIKPEMVLDGKRVPLCEFLSSERIGIGSVSETVKILEKCIAKHGGTKNKQALIDCFVKKEIDLLGKQVSLYTFLMSRQGGGLNSIEVIQVFAKLIGNSGGSKNKQAFMDCLNKLQIDLDGKKVSLCTFFMSKNGGGASLRESIQMIVKCIGCGGGSKNKDVLMDSFCELEMEIDGVGVSLYTFLTSQQGGGLSPSVALSVIVKCIGAGGGCKNKKALLDCLKKLDVDLDGKKVSLHTFISSKKGGCLSVSKSIHVITKCIGIDGGCRNKQALIECFCEPELLFEKEQLTLYDFLISERWGGLSRSEAIYVIAKCIGNEGGTKNKQAFVECLRKPEKGLGGISLLDFFVSSGLKMWESIQILVKCIGWSGGTQNKRVLIDCFCEREIDLDGEMVSLYHFLISNKGAGLSALEAMQVIAKCIGSSGGAKNKQAFLECISKPEINQDGKLVSLKMYLMSERGGGLKASDAVGVIVKCVCTVGGCKNKQVLLACLNKVDMEAGGEKMTLFEFFCSERESGLGVSDAIFVIAKCIGYGGEPKNKHALMECLCQPTLDLCGEKVSLFTFLSSKQGCNLRPSKALQIIARCIGENDGDKNKHALMECLIKEDLDVDGKKVSFYNFLVSEKMCGLRGAEAIQVLVRCFDQKGGAQTMQALKACFSRKLSDVGGGARTLYETFLSGDMTRKESLYLCLIFSVNRYVLNTQDVLSLFDSQKEGGRGYSVIGVLNSFGISGYVTLLRLVTKVLDDSNGCLESGRMLFQANCKSLVDMFVNTNSFFMEKMYKHPNRSMQSLAEKCIHACNSDTSRDINKELKIRERWIVEWISQFSGGYQLTEKSFSIITHVQSLDELKLLIELSHAEISQVQMKAIDGGYCEDSLSEGLQILTECKRSIIQAIVKYKIPLLNWFDLKTLSCLVTKKLRSLQVDQSIYYFFENRMFIESLMPYIDTKNVFLIYMGLSNAVSSSLQPLKLENIQQFFKILGGKWVEKLLRKKSDQLYPLCSIYNGLVLHEKQAYFHKVVEGIPKIFISHIIFQNLYHPKIQKDDWLLLIGLMQKWDLEKENITQEELSFLIRIRYQLFEDVVIAWKDLFRLEKCEEGCQVLNQTVYPNWVFSLAYLQKVMSYLNTKYDVVEQKESVLFEPYNDTDIKRCRFPLFNIQLNKRGFVFKNESVDSVACFYTQSRLDKCMGGIPVVASETKLSLEKKSRKRKGADIETQSIRAKEMKLGKVTMINEEKSVFWDGTQNERNPMFSKLDHAHMSPITEFEDNNISHLSPMMFNHVFDVWEQDFEFEFADF